MLTFLLTAAGMQAQPDWGYKPNAYDGEHVVYVNLVGSEGTALSLNQGDYLGAFIDGECRGQQIARTGGQAATASIWYFPIRVKGSAADNGKTITFRYYNASSNQAMEYNLSGASALSYSNETTTGTLSNLYHLTFVQPMYFSIPEENTITIKVGEKKDMKQYFTFEPANANFPTNIAWDFGNNYTYINVTDNVLTGLAACENAYLGFNLGDIKNSGQHSSFSVKVIQPATSITIKDEYKDGITVNVGDKDKLTELLKACYNAAPDDCNETLHWSCDKSEGISIVEVETGMYEFNPEKAGVYTMTVQGEKASATIKVTVVQPVTGINMTAPLKYLNIYVGENASALLPHAFAVLPDDATDKRLKYEIDPQSAEGVLVNNGNGITGGKQGEANIIVKSVANPDVSTTIPVIVSSRITSLTFKRDVLSFTQPKSDTDKSNFIDEITDNIVFDGEVKANSSTGMSIESSNSNVIKIQYNLWDTGDGNSAIVNELGTAKITVTYTHQHTELGDDGALGDKDIHLTGDFTVNVVEGLKGFVFDDVKMGVNDTYQLTITPDPASATVDPDKLEVEFRTSEMPENWTWATFTATDDSKLKYTITPKSVGDGSITVSYDGETMRSGSINIGQNYEQKTGWKWVSFFSEMIVDINAKFGNQLEEMRTSDQLLYNDPEYGYFGELTTINTGSCVKVKIKDEAPGYVSFVTIGNYYGPHYTKSMELAEKWNWMGNPYQYDHALDGLFVSDGLADGDRIVSKDDGFAEYKDGRWVGTLTTLRAGLGYMFYNADASKTTLNYKAESDFEQGTPVFHAPARHSSVWTYNSAPFADNMSIVASLGDDYAHNRYSIGAFVGDECRGEGKMIDGKFFITVHADKGERISFRLHDDLTGEFRTIGESVTFDKMAGTLDSPVKMSVGSTITGISCAQMAASGIAVVSGRLSFAGISVKHFTVASANGAVVLADDTNIGGLAPGIYIVKAVTTDGKTVSKKIVK